jgi:ATP-dependent helicase/nuclease subunit B
MVENSNTRNIFNIPAGVPFATSIAERLLTQTREAPEALVDIKILLPTRRACRVMQSAFLERSENQALILPTLQPIGDIDEEELSLALFSNDQHDNILNIPPAISRLKRQIMLAKLVQAVPDFSQGFEHAFTLAEALGHFIDQVHTENLSMSNLKDIVPNEFADHWQITLKFLEIISHEWPKILNNINYIDYSDRRNRLIKILNNYWQKNPSENKVIAAGTTGSIPAVAELLSTISKMPNGTVILPGLDQEIDDVSWSALDETHPQYGFRELFERMGVSRSEVQEWNIQAIASDTICTTRRVLAREIMRPAATTTEWTEIANNSSKQKHIKNALSNLHLFNCAHEREEAQTIALLMREAIEEPTQTATLITSDRNLAMRVKTALQRWGLDIDDSAGTPLNQDVKATFFQMVSHACVEQLSPSSLLSLLKHSLSFIEDQNTLSRLETTLLRGPKPLTGFGNLYKALENYEDTEDIQSILTNLEDALKPLIKLSTGTHDFKSIMEAHIKTTEKMCRDKSSLWSDTNENSLYTLLSELMVDADTLPEMSLEIYQNILTNIMKKVPVRKSFSHDVRLRILGQIEARLIDSDLVIMGGLNEGTWPAEPGHDPWMSRSMRKKFGLPIHERSVGLSAHDFVQGFCSPRVVITRSIKQGGGTYYTSAMAATFRNSFRSLSALSISHANTTS